MFGTIFLRLVSAGFAMASGVLLQMSHHKNVIDPLTPTVLGLIMLSASLLIPDNFGLDDDEEEEDHDEGE